MMVAGYKLQVAGLLMLLFLMLNSCGSAYQILDIAASSEKMDVTKENTIKYEDESVLVTYDIWSEKGLLIFSIFNKLDVPIYIDWKKCSFITGDNKFDYWVDETVVNSSTYYKSYLFKGSDISMILGKSESVQVIRKDERVTFIPPGARVYAGKFYVKPENYYNLGKYESKSVAAAYDPNKSINIKEVKFERNKAPLVFRNYITWSKDEGITDEVHIDNEFYLSTITEVSKKQFIGKKTLVDGYSYHYQYPYKQANRLYIKSR